MGGLVAKYLDPGEYNQTCNIEVIYHDQSCPVDFVMFQG